jgi:hypothetical protein
MRSSRWSIVISELVWGRRRLFPVEFEETCVGSGTETDVGTRLAGAGDRRCLFPVGVGTGTVGAGTGTERVRFNVRITF